jgi:antitoxin MazE
VTKGSSHGECDVYHIDEPKLFPGGNCRLLRDYSSGYTIHDIQSVSDIMGRSMIVSKWGNSLAVRLPKALVEELGLREGDELDVIAAKAGAIEVETREAKRQRALANMAARNWTSPDGYRFDRDEANER